MNRDDLLTVIRAYERDSIGIPGDTISNDRASALDRFHGRPYGDEEEGSSQVVSMDLAETVEWIIPPIMETFLAGGELGQFRAISGEDEKNAKGETEYTNHVIMKDNDGFIVIHDAIHDTLLLKNGYFKHYWDESGKTREVEYEKLTDDGLIKLLSDLKIKVEDFKAGKNQSQVATSTDGSRTVEILEHDEYQETIDIQGVQRPITYHEIKIRVKEKKRRCMVKAIPTEEMRVHKSCPGSLQESPYSAHVTTKTRSELLKMGMPRDFVKKLTSLGDPTNTNSNDIQNARDTDDLDDDPKMGIDRSMDDIEYKEHYLLVDYDDDDEAELRKVIEVGGEIPPGDEWIEVIDSVPATGMTAIRMAHRHEGISLDDRLKDLQRIKTTLTRQMLNNIYNTNNIKAVVNKRVHLPDVLQELPGGKIRINDTDPVDGAYLPIPVQSIVDKILPAIDYVDTIKGARTGVNEQTTTQDPDVLKNSTKGAFLEGLQVAGQKVRMIERMLAETGIKELFLRVHEILLKNQNFEREYKISGEFVTANPVEWRERTDFDVKVGLGTGTQEEKRRDLLFLQGLMEMPLQMGLVTPEKAYNFFADIAKTMGENNPEKYMVDPTPDENGQPKPEYAQVLQSQQNQQSNPLAEAEQVKGAMELQKQQLQGQFNLAMQQQEIQNKAQIQELERDFKARLELYKTQSMEAEKQADRESKEAIAVMQEDTKRLQAELQALQSQINKDLPAATLGGNT